jgi:hypothetical protein
MQIVTPQKLAALQRTAYRGRTPTNAQLANNVTGSNREAFLLLVTGGEYIPFSTVPADLVSVFHFLCSS